MKTILVIEDDPPLREGLAALLGKEGFHVITAETGTDAVSLYQKSHFDLVITDVFIPEMNGLRVIEFLRAQNPGQKIIVMSGSSLADPLADPLEEALRLGAKFVFKKPFDPKRLLAAVAELME